MARYQCHQCDRECSRSYNLRRRKDSGICRGAHANMLDSDEESVMSERRSLDDGKDIFRNPDFEDVEEVDEEEEGETEESEEDEEEEDNEEEEDDDDDEEDDDEDKDDIDDDEEEEEEPQKIKPWDVLMNITTDKMQDTFNETVEKALHENPGKDVQEAEEIAYDELKPKYLSEFVSRYKYLTDLSAALRKDPVNKKIQETAKRLMKKIMTRTNQDCMPSRNENS